MKYLFFIFFLVPGLVSRLRSDAAHLDHRGHLFHYDDYDSTNYLKKPCSVHDLNCIRNFFSKNTGCTPTHGPSYDPILKMLEMDVPHANVSITINNILLRGFSKGKIKTFYINKRSDSLVLEVVFDSLQVDSLKTVVTYYRKGKEPLEASDFTNIQFNDLSLTLNVRNLHDVNSIKSHVYTYVSDSHPPLIVGPGLNKEIKGHTPTTKWKYINLLGLGAQEGLLRQSPVFMDLFLKMNICDFKLH